MSCAISPNPVAARNRESAAKAQGRALHPRWLSPHRPSTRRLRLSATSSPPQLRYISRRPPSELEIFSPHCDSISVDPHQFVGEDRGRVPRESAPIPSVLLMSWGSCDGAASSVCWCREAALLMHNQLCWCREVGWLENEAICGDSAGQLWPRAPLKMRFCLLFKNSSSVVVNVFLTNHLIKRLLLTREKHERRGVRGVATRI